MGGWAWPFVAELGRLSSAGWEVITLRKVVNSLCWDLRSRAMQRVHKSRLAAGPPEGGVTETASVEEGEIGGEECVPL